MQSDLVAEPAHQQSSPTGAIFPELIRLHEAVHRCAYPADDLNDGLLQRRLDDVAYEAIALNIIYHSRRPPLHIDLVQKIEEITSRVTMIIALSARRPALATVTSRDYDRPVRPSAQSLSDTHAHLIALEQDVRTLVGEIAESQP